MAVTLHCGELSGAITLTLWKGKWNYMEVRVICHYFYVVGSFSHPFLALQSQYLVAVS